MKYDKSANYTMLTFRGHLFKRRRFAAVQWNSVSVIGDRHRRAQRAMGDEHTTRKPTLKLR